MKKTIILLVVLAFVFIGAAMITTFVAPERCMTFACFKEKMEKCAKARYINEATDATWRYDIIGLEDSECKIKVTLLQSKIGSFETKRLVGYDMECSYPKGFVGYPEKDLNRCHGRLKEELQTIVINKLYKYILENLGELKEGLGVFSNST